MPNSNPSRSYGCRRKQAKRAHPSFSGRNLPRARRHGDWVRTTRNVCQVRFLDPSSVFDRRRQQQQQQFVHILLLLSTRFDHTSDTSAVHDRDAVWTPVMSRMEIDENSPGADDLAALAVIRGSTEKTAEPTSILGSSNARLVKRTLDGVVLSRRQRKTLQDAPLGLSDSSSSSPEPAPSRRRKKGKAGLKRQRPSSALSDRDTKRIRKTVDKTEESPEIIDVDAFDFFITKRNTVGASTTMFYITFPC